MPRLPARGAGASSYSAQLKFDVPSGDGRRKTRYATVRDSYQDAQRELTRLLGELDTGALPEPSAMTVQQYLAEWLRTARTQSPKTLERYGELIRNQIDPHLGSLKVRNLRAEPVRAWCVKLLDQGFAPRTIGHAHRLLRTALVPVVREDVLTRYGLPKVEAEEIEILSEDQVSAVLKALEGHSLYPIVSLALLTCMRRGELLGLQWGDVDLDGATLRVERAVEETKAGLRLKPPKTKRGRRSISLPAEAVTMLRAHKVAQMETRLVLAQGPIKPETLVFSNVEGALLRLRNVTKAWWRIVTAHDLPHVNFHSLRHTHVSMLIRAGVDILTISRRLGHSKAAITLDVYGHLIGGADAAAAKALEGLLK